MTKQVFMPEALDAAQAARMSRGILSRGHVFLTGMTGADSEGAMPQDAERQCRNSFD